jgi:hypothetical protein
MMSTPRPTLFGLLLTRTLVKAFTNFRKAMGLASLAVLALANADPACAEFKPLDRLKDTRIEPNNRRLLEPIGNVPPAEAEAAYYAALEEPAKLAA